MQWVTVKQMKEEAELTTRRELIDLGKQIVKLEQTNKDNKLCRDIQKRQLAEAEERRIQDRPSMYCEASRAAAKTDMFVTAIDDIRVYHTELQRTIHRVVNLRKKIQEYKTDSENQALERNALTDDLEDTEEKLEITKLALVKAENATLQTDGDNIKLKAQLRQARSEANISHTVLISIFMYFLWGVVSSA